MRKVISTPWPRRLCLLALVTLVSSSVAADHAPRNPGEDLFNNAYVPRLRIEISREGMATLRSTGWGNGVERPVAKARVWEGEKVYTNVAVHLKGAMGSFRPVDENPGLTLNFEKFAPGQSFHGLHKISLNNSVQDRSFITEKICRELFEAAGVPVPRTGHAKVELNGRDLGLRVLAEGWNKQFLKRYFKDVRGNLYDGGFVQDVYDSLEVNCGQNPKNNSGLRALASAAREPDLSKRFTRLEQTLDVDRFLSYVAMDVIQCDWDGYAINKNNWRIFHDLESNKMVFFPHGLDQMFGVARTTPDCPIRPHMQGLVAVALLETPEGRRRYYDRLTQLYTNVFHLEALLQRVDEIAALIQPVIAETNPQAARTHEMAVLRLKKRITDRDRSLSQQLAARISPAQFGSTGVMPLGHWVMRTKSGDPVFREKKTSDGKTLLYIGALNGEIIGSWRTRVSLEPGTYRFEGKLRTRDVEPGSGEANHGAGLRISGGPTPKEVVGTVEWQKFSYPFRVPDNGAEVELVCELSAARGEVTFDPATLQLVRLE
jgi:spore coat protein CotH